MTLVTLLGAAGPREPSVNSALQAVRSRDCCRQTRGLLREERPRHRAGEPPRCSRCTRCRRLSLGSPLTNADG